MRVCEAECHRMIITFARDIEKQSKHTDFDKTNPVISSQVSHGPLHKMKQWLKSIITMQFYYKLHHCKCSKPEIGFKQK